MIIKNLSSITKINFIKVKINYFLTHKNIFFKK